MLIDYEFIQICVDPINYYPKQKQGTITINSDYKIQITNWL